MASHSSIVTRETLGRTIQGRNLDMVTITGPASETGQHYCINSAALRFIPAENLAREGYGDWLHLFDEAKENEHD